MENAIILLIEDEADIAVTTKYSLEHEGYKVFIATSGQEAIDKFKSISPNLILLDIRMPVMNGFETLKLLRDTYSDAKDIPVIMLTASSQPESILKAKELGVAGYVVKSGDSLNLISKIKEMLSE